MSLLALEDNTIGGGLSCTNIDVVHQIIRFTLTSVNSIMSDVIGPKSMAVQSFIRLKQLITT